MSVKGAGSVYLEEAVVLCALQVMREWMLPVDLSLLQHVNILAGGALVHYQIKGQSAAASGLVHDIRRMAEWLHTENSYIPFRLPDDPTDVEAPLTQHQEVSLGIPEYVRVVGTPSLGPGWTEQLPGVPMVTEEIKTFIRVQREEDENSIEAAGHSGIGIGGDLHR